MKGLPGSFSTAALLVLLCAGNAHTYDPTYLGNPMGVVDHDEFTGIRNLHGHWVRLPVQWNYVEPEDDVFNWESGISAWLDSTDVNEINASVVLQIGQMWASGFPTGTGEWPSYPPTDLTTSAHPTYAYSRTYYDFVFQFLSHYRGRIDRITVENEANTTNFWRGTMDQYRRLLATAKKAADDAAPEVLVFDSGLGSGSWGAAAAEWMYQSGLYSDAEVLQYANDYYEYDVYAPFQWGSFQELMYWLNQPFVQENNKHVRYMLATVPEHADGLNFKFTERWWLLPGLIDFMDAAMAEYGHSLPLKVNNEASNWPLGTADAEAQNLLKMYVVGLSRGVAQALWFPYRQDDTPRRALYNEAGVRTKQADAFQSLAQRLGASPTYVGFEHIDGRVHRYRFRRAGETVPRVDAMWWDNGGHGSGARTITIILPENTDHVNVYEWDGRVTEVAETDTLVTTVSHLGRLYEYVPSIIGIEESAPPVASERLSQNVPNPFVRSTAISVRLEPSMVQPRIEIFDAGGRLVRTVQLGAGGARERTVAWDGRSDRGDLLPAGTYFYRFGDAGHTSGTRAAILVR